MNSLKSSLEIASTLASLHRDVYLYTQLSDEGKRAIKANALRSISFAATFATASIATGLFGASMIGKTLLANPKDLGEFGLGCLATYAGGLFSMTVAAPANLVISHLVSSRITDKFFPKQQSKPQQDGRSSPPVYKNNLTSSTSSPPKIYKQNSAIQEQDC